MQSAELKALQSIADVLLKQGLSNSQVLDEVSLLVAWASYSTRNFGRVQFSNEQTKIQGAYEEMATNLGECGVVFRTSCLHNICPIPTLNKIVELLQSIDFSQPKRLAEALIDVSEKQNQRSPDQPISKEIGKLLAALIGSKRAALYHWLSATALLYIDEPAKVTLRVQRATPLIVAISSILETKLEVTDSIYEKAEYQVENVISAPPMGANISVHGEKARSDEAALSRALDEVENVGVILVPPSVLFQRSSLAIREQIVRRNYLEAIVTLTRGELSFTALTPVLIVLNKHRQAKDPVQFYELDSKGISTSYDQIAQCVISRAPGAYGVTTTTETIEENNFDLSTNRYVLGLASDQLKQIENAFPLAGLAEIIRAQSLKYDEGNPDITSSALEAAVKDICDSGKLGRPEKQITVDESQKRRMDSQRLRQGDILLVIKGSVGRVAFVAEDCGDNWIAGQAFVIIRPKKQLSSEYLYRFLSSQLIQSYLDEISTGATMRMLKASDIEDLPIPLPTPELKAQIEENHRAIQAEYAAIKKHRDNIASLTSEHWTVTKVLNK